jgi:hypothetical protein
MNGANIIACIWDFDKTIIPGFMQETLFKAFHLDSKKFWAEVNALPQRYAQQNIGVTEDLLYLNHMLTYVKEGLLQRLNNKKLRELGQELPIFDGLPAFFEILKHSVEQNEIFQKHNIKLEHYIISCGLAEMIRGSKIAPYVDGIFGCEFIEDPMLPGFLSQENINLSNEVKEIAQIGRVVDNTSKTRYLFEINKGVNKNPNVSVNASMPQADRRIPIENMIYIADGPSDIPMFAIIKERGGKTFAVHTPDSMQEFRQNDMLLQNGRVDCYGPADYRPGTLTYRWLMMHVTEIAERLVRQEEQRLQQCVHNPPPHQSETSKKTFDQQMALFD